jgi:hypothetical protein
MPTARPPTATRASSAQPQPHPPTWSAALWPSQRRAAEHRAAAPQQPTARHGWIRRRFIGACAELGTHAIEADERVVVADLA